jgi:hypothetical protein
MSETSDSVYREAVAKLKILLSASEAVDRVSLLYSVIRTQRQASL